jgi:hypothetical protein
MTHLSTKYAYIGDLTAHQDFNNGLFKRIRIRVPVSFVSAWIEFESVDFN